MWRRHGCMHEHRGQAVSAQLHVRLGDDLLTLRKQMPAASLRVCAFSWLRVPGSPRPTRACGCLFLGMHLQPCFDRASLAGSGFASPASGPRQPSFHGPKGTPHHLSSWVIRCCCACSCWRRPVRRHKHFSGPRPSTCMRWGPGCGAAGLSGKGVVDRTWLPSVLFGWGCPLGAGSRPGDIES